MKKTVPIILIVLIGFYIYNMEKSNSELLEMNKKLTFENINKSMSSSNRFIYQNGNQKIEMKMLNGKNYLVYDNSTETEFIINNIELKDIIVYGTGIRIIGNGEGKLKTEINVPKNYTESDTLTVKIKIKEKEKLEFNIPLKNAE